MWFTKSLRPERCIGLLGLSSPALPAPLPYPRAPNPATSSIAAPTTATAFLLVSLSKMPRGSYANRRGGCDHSPRCISDQGSRLYGQGRERRFPCPFERSMDGPASKTETSNNPTIGSLELRLRLSPRLSGFTLIAGAPIVATGPHRLFSTMHLCAWARSMSLTIFESEENVFCAVAEMSFSPFSNQT